MPSSFRSNVSSMRVRVLAQGVIALILCLLMVWQAWHVYQNAQTNVTDRFWGAVALALFLGGLAQVNIVGFVRERLRTPSTQQYCTFPIHLYADGDARGLAWPMLSMAFTFGMPCIPLLLLSITATTHWLAELRLIWIGFTLSSALIGGITLFMGVRAIYTSLTGTQIIVEVESATIAAGDSMRGAIHHTSGRIAAQMVEIALVCRQTYTKRSSRQTTTTYLHQQDLITPSDMQAVSGQASFPVTLTIPPRAYPSAPYTANPMVVWSIDVKVVLHNAPDITMTFPFTVIKREHRSSLS
ncbi:MAG TPA: hypothetical protein VD886_24270 [Herpetosiphonaceae bacterium]|nr:hypothetical protein [Herpetosiphonaceae bacterium]